MQLTAAQHVMCIHIHTPALVTRTLYLHMRYIAFYVIYRSLPRRKLRSKRMLDCLLVNLVSFILCLTCIICFNACHVACSLLTSEQTSAALKFQEPFYCQNCLSKFCLFKVCLTLNLLSPDLIIYIPATYQTLIHIIVDLTFRITTCRSLLAIAFRT